MSGLTFLLALAALVGVALLVRRVATLEEQVRSLEAHINTRPATRLPPTEPEARAAPLNTMPPPSIVEPDGPTAAFEPAPSATPEPAAPSAPARPRREPISLENLIGGRLPIWIGGAALVLAAFFLVRYSIESGLLGPTARTLIAALFGIALLAASEVARRFPATAEDPRISQVLAGAGIASLYGTLYMAAALYHLLAPLPAFVAVLLVTGVALAMALRHGPPTAIMALLGGFLAPLVAGFDAAGTAPLLVYLALFVAAIFGLAIQRGWGWLALAASIAGFAWINFLILMLTGREGDLSAVGAFTMLLAAGASVALPATGVRSPLLRLAPLVAGFVQLVALAPALDFGALAWSFYLILAAAALVLAWRDPLYLPAALAALPFLLLLEVLALLQPEHSVTPIAAIAAALLFAAPGHALVGRARGWAWIALGGSAGPLLVAHAAAPALLPSIAWGLLELAAGAAAGRLAYLHREHAEARLLLVASVTTALLAAVGLAQFVPHAWLALPLTAALVGLALWAQRVAAPSLFPLVGLPYVAALVAAGLPVAALAELVSAALIGDALPYLRLPPLTDLLRSLALPTLALLLFLRDPRQLGRFRRLVGSVAIAVAILLLYALAKQVLAIATPPRFVEWGFVERALLTQACLGAAWLLYRTERFPTLATMLLGLALFRLGWFDLLLLNPVLRAQQVGALPLLNAAFLHLAGAAAWLWTLRARPGLRPIAALLTLAAALALVRQATHGTLMTGPIGTLENGGYSAALLAVAAFWLWRGIAAGLRDLRVAGLALLTLVTFKVFLIDAAALDGILRILSFLALGVALIGIGWAYNRFLGRSATPSEPQGSR